MPNAFARFYCRSFCDLVFGSAFFAGSTDYSGASLIYANDRDYSTCATTSGKNSDATAVEFIIDLGVLRNIDTVAFLSNLRDFEVSYSAAGSSYTNMEIVTDNDDAVHVTEIGSPVSARYIKIYATATNPADQEKKIYEVAVTAKICDLPVSEITTLEQNYIRTSDFNLRGGSIQVVLFPQSPKFHAVIGFKNLVSLYDSYDDLKDAFVLDACIIRLYYSDSIHQLGNESFYLVNDISQKSFPLSGNVLSAGVDGSIELMEV